MLNMDKDAVMQLQRRQYFHKEMPALVGTSKWLLNRDLRPHRLALGPRNGNRWSFFQVLEILRLFAVAYEIIE